MDFLKSQLQIQYGPVKKYNGLVDCAIKIAKEGGIRGMYQGFGATMFRDVPATALYFGSYGRATVHNLFGTLDKHTYLVDCSLDSYLHWRSSVKLNNHHSLFSISNCEFFRIPKGSHAISRGEFCFAAIMEAASCWRLCRNGILGHNFSS